MKYHTGDQLVVKIKKIVPNGLGMGFAENLTVFVPLTAVGDTLSVEIRQLKGKTAFAAVLQILDPGPDRVDAPCVYFGECGGCDFQHLSYEAQLHAKSEIIRDCLTRIGHINYEGDIRILPSPREFGYRLRTQFHSDFRTGETGFFRRHSHTVIDIDECLVLTDEMNGTLSGLRNAIKEIDFEGNILNIETAAVDDESSISCDPVSEPVREISIRVGREKYFFSAGSFFQANRFMLEPLVKEAVGDEAGAIAVDLYCGSGLFSLPLARSFKRVAGVESDGACLNFARKSRDAAQLSNLEFYEGRVKDFFEAPPYSKADLVLIDPPRSGVKRNLIGSVADFASRIVYVSCNPSTLARDLGIFLKSGFEIKSIVGLDLFPQNHHVETVVKLEK